MRLTLHRVGHRFGDGPWLFTDLDIELGDGELCALTGPSGSGKSTLLSILAGWQTPAAGEVHRDGVAGIAWVAQNPFGVAGRTALDHVVLALMAGGLTRRDAEPAAHRTLARFGIDQVAGQAFRQLSGGEAQRLMLARATVMTAGLLLVDEPTAQLDTGSAATVIETLGAVAGGGRIAVVATHDPRVAATCTRTIRLGAAP